MTLQFQITLDQENQIFDLLTQDISTNPPTFIEHYHFESLEEVHEEIKTQSIEITEREYEERAHRAYYNQYL